MYRYIVQLSFLFLTSHTMAQTAYYVSTTGADSNTGLSISQAWQTIQHATDEVGSNSIINILAGTYNEKIEVYNSGTLNQPIVIQNYESDEVIVDGSNLPSRDAIIAIFDQSYIHIQGLIVANNEQLDAQGILVEGNCKGIQIRSNEIYNINFSSNAADVANATRNAQPLIVYGSNASNAVTDLVLANNVVRDSRTGYSEGLAVNGNVDGFIVENNRVYNIANIGIDIIGHEGTASANDQARNGTIKNNTVYNCKSPYATAAGIYVDGGKDLIIEANRIFDCQWGIEIGCEAVGQTTSDIIVRSNIVYANDDAGITIGGFDFPTGSGKVIDCGIYNNTLYANDDQTDGVGGTNAEVTISYTENCTFQNNIFYATNASNRMLIVENASSINLALDYNLYYANTDFLFQINSNSYATFSIYQSIAMLDLNSTFEDPAFQDLDVSNFHLSSTSPALNTGSPISNTAFGTTDYDGNNRNNDQIDRGADEHYSCTSALVLTGDLFSNSYNASTSILSDTYISKGSVMNYMAPETTLQEAFEVSDMGILSVYTDACN